MFRLLLMNSLGLSANTPSHSREIDKEDMMVYDLKGSPRKFVRDYLTHELGQGDVWVVQDGSSFAVVELTFSGFRITGTHDHNGHFHCHKAESLIEGVNAYCKRAS